MHIGHSTYPFQFISSRSQSPFPCLYVAPHLLSLERVFWTCEKSSITSWLHSQWYHIVHFKYPLLPNRRLVCVQYYWWLSVLVILSDFSPLDISLEPRMLINLYNHLQFPYRRALLGYIVAIFWLDESATDWNYIAVGLVVSYLVQYESGDLEHQSIKTYLPQFG